MAPATFDAVQVRIPARPGSPSVLPADSPSLTPEVGPMKFAQIIEFTTARIDEFNAGLDEWMATSDGHRIPHRAVLRRDRDAQDRYLLMVEFASYEVGMENSSRPETGEFAAFLAKLCDGPLKFRNLDVLREEDL